MADAFNDYAELEIAHNDARPVGDIEFIDSIEEELTGKLKSKAFRDKIKNSKSSRAAVLPFLAAVKLDLTRNEPIGLFDLFSVWLELGNKYWLNPMDKNNGLGVLEEILFKFQGNARALSPFIALINQVAKNGISPRSFVEYVILPRTRYDNNWRKWKETHLEALEIIAGLINKIKERPPFNQDHLGSGKTRLARDVVLVRYIGRPLARFPLSQLCESASLENYLNAWQKISLQDPISIYFMRNNALHFVYLMSGKIDLVQLIAIIEQLPEIERSFSVAFPEGIAKLEKIQSMNLYDYNIEHALQARRKRGFHSLDFTIEIKAYFEIVRALLEKSTGVYLCAYYASLLKQYKNPVMAEKISRLVRVIDDRGGMHIYKWHTKKLLKQNDMTGYLDFIETHNGCDPEYPKIHLLFRDEEAARDNLEIEDLLDELNLRHYFKNETNVSYKSLLNSYTQEYPKSAELITGYQDQLLSGLEYQWTENYIQQLDSLGAAGKNLHHILLRSVIRGIGRGIYFGSKSSSFKDLFSQYGSVNSQQKISAKTSFIMPIKKELQSSSDKDAAARKTINLLMVERVWAALSNPDSLNTGSVVPYLNKWTKELDEPLQKAFNEKVQHEKIIEEASDEKTLKESRNIVEKQDKTIAALRQKKENYTVIMEEFNSLDDEQKFILALTLAGASGNAEFSAYVTGLFLQRYKDLESVSSRMVFLKEDISVDVLSYRQFEYFLNILDTLFFVLSADKKIAGILNKDTVLQNILKPYLITKKKLVTLEALDAAAKKMTDYASMQAERSKWQGVIEKMEQKDKKFFHDMTIYTSKTFMDSYYGEMGGICLSAHPQEILRPGFFVQRLVDNTDGEIIGMSILYLSKGDFGTFQHKSKNFWQAFAINPLSSVLKHCSVKQQLYLYLQFRLNMEKIAWMTKLPVLISGIETNIGLISNDGCFCDLIRKYETSKETAMKVRAKGISIYYSENAFSASLLIIDPRGYEKVQDPSQIPTFYAHRRLKEINF